MSADDLFAAIARAPSRAAQVSERDAFRAGPDTFNLWRIARELDAKATTRMLVQRLEEMRLPELEWRTSLAARDGADPAVLSTGQDHFLLSYEWRTMRMRALKRYGARCQCCGTTAADGATINVDHVKPRRSFPELALDENNLQVLCGACNQGKGNWDSTDWRTGCQAAT